MKIGKTRRDFIQSRLTQLMVAEPRATNQELAQRVGIHRNTLSQYIGQIQSREEIKNRVRQKMILSRLEEQAQAIRLELMGLWTDSYHSLYSKNPSQLVQISKQKWRLEKELTSVRLLLSTDLKTGYTS